jgi:hypothetical protein
VTPQRLAVLRDVAAAVLALPSGRIARVGIDGYVRECEPWRRASLVIDNDDPAAPFVVSAP